LTGVARGPSAVGAVAGWAVGIVGRGWVDRAGCAGWVVDVVGPGWVVARAGCADWAVDVVGLGWEVGAGFEITGSGSSAGRGA
jgi:hypothetical protein